MSYLSTLYVWAPAAAGSASSAAARVVLVRTEMRRIPTSVLGRLGNGGGTVQDMAGTLREDDSSYSGHPSIASSVGRPPSASALTGRDTFQITPQGDARRNAD